MSLSLGGLSISGTSMRVPPMHQRGGASFDAENDGKDLDEPSTAVLFDMSKGETSSPNKELRCRCTARLRRSFKCASTRMRYPERRSAECGA